ncbi:proteasome-associated protein ECM29 homolog [Musca autumnalis]|uniref:proteasome-associated protein ECM29 homolog n=1 Tax=Musca autumnalis TaxID=221902 RepID=UPI003CF90C04
MGHAFSRIIQKYKQYEVEKYYQNWSQFVDATKFIAEFLVKGPQDLLISAAAKCFSMISKWTVIPKTFLNSPIRLVPEPNSTLSPIVFCVAFGRYQKLQLLTSSTQQEANVAMCSYRAVVRR